MPSCPGSPSKNPTARRFQLARSELASVFHLPPKQKLAKRAHQPSPSLKRYLKRRREHFRSTSAAEEERRSLSSTTRATRHRYPSSTRRSPAESRSASPDLLFARARLRSLCIGSPLPCKTTRLGRPLNKNPSARAPVDERGGFSPNLRSPEADWTPRTRSSPSLGRG